MTILSIADAAQAVGCTRQHIYRLVGKGRLSSVSRPDGTRGIDTSELLRVFGSIKNPPAQATAGDSHQVTTGDSRRQPHEPALQASQVLEVELRAAKDALRVAEDRLREAQDRENRLLELLAAQARMLEYRPSSPPPATPEPEPPKSQGIRTAGGDFSIPSFTDWKPPRPQ